MCKAAAVAAVAAVAAAVSAGCLGVLPTVTAVCIHQATALRFQAKSTNALSGQFGLGFRFVDVLVHGDEFHCAAVQRVTFWALKHQSKIYYLERTAARRRCVQKGKLRPSGMAAPRSCTFVSCREGERRSNCDEHSRRDCKSSACAEGSTSVYVTRQPERPTQYS